MGSGGAAGYHQILRAPQRFQCRRNRALLAGHSRWHSVIQKDRSRWNENAKGPRDVALGVQHGRDRKAGAVTIGKSRNPRCFKNVKRLPVDYQANKNAWMTSELWSEWLKKLDNKMRRQKR